MRHNINMGIDESLAAFAPIVAEARERGWWVRAYVSTAFGCPYEGEVDERAVVALARAAAGAGHRRAGDQRHARRGRAGRRPARARRARGGRDRRQTCRAAPARHARARRWPTSWPASSWASAPSTPRPVEPAARPYAPGSAGNLATEDLVYLLDRQGLRHGVDLDGVLAAARFIAERARPSRWRARSDAPVRWPR